MTHAAIKRDLIPLSINNNVQKLNECHNPNVVGTVSHLSSCVFPIRRGGNELRWQGAGSELYAGADRPAHATTTPHRKFRLRYWLCESSRSHAHLITYISPQRSSCPVALASSSKYPAGLTV